MHATVTIRIAYDEASGTVGDVRQTLDDSLSHYFSSGGLTRNSELVVEDYEVEVEVDGGENRQSRKRVAAQTEGTRCPTCGNSLGRGCTLRVCCPGFGAKVKA